MMLAHHKGRATTSEGPARPPAGSHIVATGGRRRRLTMSRHHRRDASYPVAALCDQMYHPSMKVSTSAGRGRPPAWLSSLRCGRAFALASEPMKVFIGSLV